MKEKQRKNRVYVVSDFHPEKAWRKRLNALRPGMYKADAVPNPTAPGRGESTLQTRPSGAGSYRSVDIVVPVSTYRTDPRIDEYIESLPGWQQDICRQVRDLVHAADPDVIETIKRTKLPYFTLEGNICALLGAKDHVNVFVYDPIAPDPEGIINQGHGNLTARAIQLRQDDVVNDRALVKLFKAVIANNRAGGWRKVKAKSG